MTPLNTVITALLALAAVATDAAAQAYPNKPIRLIVPYAVGGASDLMARAIAQKLGAGLGVQVIADNRGGTISRIGLLG